MNDYGGVSALGLATWKKERMVKVAGRRLPPRRAASNIREKEKVSDCVKGDD